MKDFLLTSEFFDRLRTLLLDGRSKYYHKLTYDFAMYVYMYVYYIFQEYEEPVYSYSTYPDRRFSSRYPNILKMSPPFASSEGVSASGDRYQSDGV